MSFEQAALAEPLSVLLHASRRADLVPTLRPAELPQSIVVLGAGGAGARVISSLSKTLPPSSYNLVHVDSRPYYVHWPATIRMVVTADGNLEETALVPLDKNFMGPNGVFRVGTAYGLRTL